MSDPRLTADPAAVTEATPAQITRPVADLLRRPDGPRDRQLLFGEAVTVLARAGDHAYVRAGKDGYHGYILARDCGPRQPVTHRIWAPATHVYDQADLKSRDRMSLSFGSCITALSERNAFVETPDGFVPAPHVMPTRHTGGDPAAIAMLFLGTPYLWGGNSRFGIDCSGLVQAACLACGLDCPGDSDQQQAGLGADLPDGTPYRRNDLIFWKGHVALMVDPLTLIHANGGHMSVTLEPVAAAIARIAAAGDGRPTAHKRLVIGVW